MMRKSYLILSGAIFLLVACLHLARIIFAWQVHVAAWEVPFWLSWGGTFGASILAVWAFQEARKK